MLKSRKLKQLPAFFSKFEVELIFESTNSRTFVVQNATTSNFLICSR